MGIRIKSHWHREESDRSPKEIGGAIAFIAWRIALDKAITLHGEDYVYNNDQQRLGVIAEYLAFETQIADRIVYEQMKPEERQELVTELVLKLANHYQDNAREMVGPGDHADQFIKLFNQRSGEYAEFKLTDDGPSYPFLRHLGFEIQEIMGGERENHWVIDQVMDRDAPDVYKQLTRAVKNLFY
ncbi:hypothetical protein DJ030_17895 [bacterium endosymbiont of Escarpia laminata]|nr:MAG: hypothetical protein DJ030_17895 [bacterium endosymbiont of Escarpia laminata]